MSPDLWVPVGVQLMVGLATGGVIRGAHRQVVADLKSNVEEIKDEVRQLEGRTVSKELYEREYALISRRVDDVDGRRKDGDAELDHRLRNAEQRIPWKGRV